MTRAERTERARAEYGCPRCYYPAGQPCRSRVPQYTPLGRDHPRYGRVMTSVHPERLALVPEKDPPGVWLAEKSGAGVAADVVGIFSSLDKAEDACWGIAGEYFGKERTAPLRWLRQAGGGYSSAPYHHPCAGMFLFQVTRFRVDEVMI